MGRESVDIGGREYRSRGRERRDATGPTNHWERRKTNPVFRAIAAVSTAPRTDSYTVAFRNRRAFHRYALPDAPGLASFIMVPALRAHVTNLHS